MKEHFFKGIADGFIKHAEGGYEEEGADTVFGTRPGEGCDAKAKPMDKKSLGKPKAKMPINPKEKLPKAPGPNDSQR